MGKRSRIRGLGGRIARKLRPSSESKGLGGSADTTRPPAPPRSELLIPEGMAAEDVLEKLKAIKGPVLINHWATWCDGCVEELPLLVELQAEFGNEVTFVGVSWELFQFQRPDAIEHAEDFAREHGVAWPSFFVANQPSRFFELFEMECMTIPQIEIQNADGGVIYRLEKVLESEEMQRLRDALESLRS